MAKVVKQDTSTFMRNKCELPLSWDFFWTNFNLDEESSTIEIGKYVGETKIDKAIRVQTLEDIFDILKIFFDTATFEWNHTLTK